MSSEDFSNVEDAREFLAAMEQAEREERVATWAAKEEREFKRAPEQRAHEHRERAHELKSIRRKLANSADGKIHRAASLVAGREAERLSDEDFAAFRSAVNAASSELLLAERLRKQQRQHRQAAKKIAKVLNEPSPYGEDSPHSFFADMTAAISPESASEFVARGLGGDMSPAAVQERRRCHAIDVGRALRKRDKYGKAIERVLRESRRQADAGSHREAFRKDLREYRALTTGGGTTVSASGGGAAAFVVPYFLLSEWAPFRGIYRTFADQCNPLPLPPYGMQVVVPYFSSTDLAAQETEGAGVAEGIPTAAVQTGQVVTQAGQVTVSQQALDRGFGGGALDRVIARDLRQRLDEKIDLYALNTTIAAAGAVAGQATFSFANLYQDLALAREAITDTAGVRLRPTHLFTTSDLYSYASRQVDSSGRPMLQPQFGPGNLTWSGKFPTFSGSDDGRNGGNTSPEWARFTGTVLPAGILWFLDDNIPASGSNTQLVVSAPEQSVDLFESPDPILSVYPETYANSLAVVLNLRAYVAVVTRHASGTQVITSNAYATSLK